MHTYIHKLKLKVIAVLFCQVHISVTCYTTEKQLYKRKIAIFQLKTAPRSRFKCNFKCHSVKSLKII